MTSCSIIDMCLPVLAISAALIAATLIAAPVLLAVVLSRLDRRVQVKRMHQMRKVC